MILTEKRIAANRANAQKSTGPKTPEGRAHSSQNSTKHGLLAKLVVLRHEDQAAFEETVQALVDRIKPTDDVETGIVYQMAPNNWRIGRSIAIETRMLQNEMDARLTSPSEIDRMTSAFTDLATGPKFSPLHRHEARLNTMNARLRSLLASGQLINLRRHFPAAEPAPTAADPEPEPVPSPATEEEIRNEATKSIAIIKTPLCNEPIEATEPTPYPFEVDPACEAFDPDLFK